MHSMLRQNIRTTSRRSVLRQLGRCGFSTTLRSCNELLTPKVNYEAKYAEKLQARAAEQGLSVEQLRQKLKEEEAAQRKEKAAVNVQSTPEIPSTPSPSAQPAKDKAPSTTVPPASIPTRKDSSPVKPLAELLNLEKLLQTPHTPEQISLLWRAYHASRSKGTGRGYLCATIPLDAYHKMTSVAANYPSFVLPVPRENAQVQGDQTSEDQKAYEMYFMEWSFHGAPKPTTIDLFAKPAPSNNPQVSTVLFTPLQEYKQRASFATPYLVLTNYTDLASSHGIVLLRGEITPSTSGSIDAGGDGRYMLSQQDAQLLAMGIQKFYLWSEEQGKRERELLLKTFHDRPEEFKWEELLKHTDFSA